MNIEDNWRNLQENNVTDVTKNPSGKTKTVESGGLVAACKETLRVLAKTSHFKQDACLIAAPMLA